MEPRLLRWRQAEPHPPKGPSQRGPRRSKAFACQITSRWRPKRACEQPPSKWNPTRATLRAPPLHLPAEPLQTCLAVNVRAVRGGPTAETALPQHV